MNPFHQSSMNDSHILILKIHLSVHPCPDYIDRSHKENFLSPTSLLIFDVDFQFTNSTSHPNANLRDYWIW